MTFPRMRFLAPPPFTEGVQKIELQVGHVCLAPAGGPKARDGHHVSA